MTANNLLIMSHGGLGDFIIINSIIRAKAKLHELVCLPVKYGNVPSVTYMLRDLDNVVIRPVEDDEEALFFRDSIWKFQTLNLGGFGNGFDGRTWDFSFYLQAGVEYQDRWSKWACPRDEAAEQKVFMAATDDVKPMVFLHCDRTRGLVFDEKRPEILPVFKSWERRETTCVSPQPFITPILFHWRKVIEHCDEIHCMSSSFSAFIDSIDLPKNPKLFLHQYVRGNEAICGYQKNWEILK